MIKRYTSKTELAFNVKTAGGSVHVHFDPSQHGSMFITKSKVLQDGLRNHRYYGKLFHEMPDIPAPVPAPVAQPVQENVNTNGVKTIKVSSLQEAKDHLVELGVSRTQLTSKAKILAQAAANKVQFDGI